MNVKQSSIHRSKILLFLCETVHLCHYYTINHCFPLFFSISQIRGYILWLIWFRSSFSVVSVYVKQKEWDILWKGRGVTLFCCRAVARYCAPSSPIQLLSRLRVVSVYVKQNGWEILWKGRGVTLFCCRALVRCCAPSSPIWLLLRFSVVRVYVKQK
jgi:hypothetical protein